MLLASGGRQHKENVWVLQILISKVVWVLRSFVLVHRAWHPCLTCYPQTGKAAHRYSIAKHQGAVKIVNTVSRRNDF